MTRKQKATTTVKYPEDIPYADEMLQCQDKIIRGVGCGFVGVRHSVDGVRLTIESEWDTGTPSIRHGNFAKIGLTCKAVDELIAALLESKYACIEDR